jgi:hypothetical protein
MRIKHSVNLTFFVSSHLGISTYVLKGRSYKEICCNYVDVTEFAQDCNKQLCVVNQK